MIETNGASSVKKGSGWVLALHLGRPDLAALDHVDQGADGEVDFLHGGRGHRMSSSAVGRSWLWLRGEWNGCGWEGREREGGEHWERGPLLPQMGFWWQAGAADLRLSY
jgi:hypothetical protein